MSKSLSKAKFVNYICVYSKEGDHMVARFVTDVDYHSARWEAGKPAMKFAQSYAEDIVQGLTFNGFAAGMVRVLNGVEFSNPKVEG